MATKKAVADSEIVVSEVKIGRIEVCLVGTSPMIFNRMSEKAKHQLLLGSTKKTAADKAANLKHSPREEYRASVYKSPDDKAKARLRFPSTGFKKAIASAALDTPGAKKAQIGRLVFIESEHVEIFGVPQLYMSVVRSSDMNRTPDIRTRAILPEWACRLSIQFQRPMLNEQVIMNLLTPAGLFVGIGDFRQEKGAGSFGQFKVVSEDDADFVRITKNQARVAQDRGLESPELYDSETEEMLTWFDSEISRKGLKAVA